MKHTCENPANNLPRYMQDGLYLCYFLKAYSWN